MSITPILDIIILICWYFQGLGLHGCREVCETLYNIARNRGHFAPVINCQRNLIFKMADKDYRSQGKHIPYDILNNLSSVDLFYEEKGKKKTSSKKILGVYQAEWQIARIHTAQKPAA